MKFIYESYSGIKLIHTLNCIPAKNVYYKLQHPVGVYTSVRRVGTRLEINSGVYTLNYSFANISDYFKQVKKDFAIYT